MPAFERPTNKILLQGVYGYLIGERKNNSYFYFPSLIPNCVIYSIKKIFAKETAKQKIFRGRPKALKISILFKMMISFACNHHCYNCFLYFDCL